MKIDQWTPGIQVTWTPARVQAALIQHQLGSFDLSSRLVEAMWQDDELPTSLDTSTNFITGSDFRLEPEHVSQDEPDPLSQSYADQLAPMWDDCYPDNEIGSLFNWFRMLGVAVGTLDWYRVDGQWKSKLRVLHPQFLWWDEGDRDPQTGLWGVFKYNTRDGIQTVTPGDGKWVLLSDGRESWMRCGVRALATTWLIKQYTLRDWARYNERHGLPIVKNKVPIFADASDKELMFQDIKNLGSDTTIQLPIGFSPEKPEVGFDLELLEATDKSWETFQATIERCDRKFQVYFLGTNTNELIGTAGSRATSESGRSISMQKAQELINRVAADIREQLVFPLLKFNYPSPNYRMAPYPRWLVEGDEDLEKRAATTKTFAESLVSLKNAGYKLSNIDQEGRQYGLELEEHEVEEPEAQPGQPGQAAAQQEPEEDDDDEELAALAVEKPTFELAQESLDTLADQLTEQAAKLEEDEADMLAEMIASATSSKDLMEKLEAYASIPEPMIGSLFEQAIFVGQLSGLVSASIDDGESESP